MKILQIIPAPPGMCVRYVNEDGSVFNSPVLVFALVEWDGKRWVQPLDFDSGTGVAKPYVRPEDVEGFKCYFFETSKKY